MAHYTAERLRRMAEDMGAVGEPTSMGSWFVPVLEHGRERQLEAYLIESLHCVLTHKEALIALRAFGQACQYMGELRGGKVSQWSFYSDALMAGRNRIEAHIGRTLFAEGVAP